MKPKNLPFQMGTKGVNILKTKRNFVGLLMVGRFQGSAFGLIFTNKLLRLTVLT
jgi:hypothetical protein